MTRATAAQLDARDPLARFRDRFLLPEDVVYLDGNSLGPLTVDVASSLTAIVDEWSTALVGGWDRWLSLPGDVGDRLGATVLGAAPGQTLVCDTTTVNLFKVLHAALATPAVAGRSTIVVEREAFPTDRYVASSVAATTGGRVAFVPQDPTPDDVTAVLDEDVAVVLLGAVDYRTAAMADIAEITTRVHDRGALVVWDLSHAAGVVPLALDEWGVDLAVGCTYKFLDAGPGAPAYLYAAGRLLPDLDQPIHGWFGADDQFAMAHDYVALPGIGRFLTGTPNVAGMVAVDASIALHAEAGVQRIRAKAEALTSFTIELLDDAGLEVASPRDASRRGAHVAVRHPRAAGIVEALARDHRVITDHRRPDIVRLGLSPLCTRFVDLVTAVDALAAVASRLS